jgi:hypothetical protein
MENFPLSKRRLNKTEHQEKGRRNIETLTSTSYKINSIKGKSFKQCKNINHNEGNTAKKKLGAGTQLELKFKN